MMKRPGKIIADSVFVLQVLIVFILVFEERIELPAIVQSLGRTHPMVLHLPIGILLVTAMIIFLDRYFVDQSYPRLVSLLIHLTALSASATTLMGLLLSFEDSFTGNDLTIHKWAGVLLSFLCWALLTLHRNTRALKPVAAGAVVILVVTGHYGARLTHGENFVWAPLSPENVPTSRNITDSSTVFEAAVQSILDAKCVSCHNPDKSKGRLVLSNAEGVRKGGKNGSLFAKTTHDGLLMERLLLPLEHDDHMPPKDKAQLLPDEIALLHYWIKDGADMTLPLYALKSNDTLQKLTLAVIARYHSPEQKPTYNFAFASQNKIQSLNKPNRTVSQIAIDEPAIAVAFYLRTHFKVSDLEELLDIRTQLVSLDLSRMPVTEEAMKVIARFENLEKLNLNHTDLKGGSLQQLRSLSKLRSISLAGTAVTAEDLSPLASLPSLREVYIWNTQIDEQQLSRLAGSFRNVRWESGFLADDDELIKLNPPLLKNKDRVLGDDEKVVLHHSLPGTVIRYTVDGSIPDSVSYTYTDGISVDVYAQIKARAYREGWATSDVVEFAFFRKGILPDTAMLQSLPDDKYPGEGVASLFDGVKGVSDFYKHPSWMAFRENDLVLDFKISSTSLDVSHLTLSFSHHPQALCFPPAEMELWGGAHAGDLQLISRVTPSQNSSRPDPRTEGVTLAMGSEKLSYYRLIARPVRSRPGQSSKDALWLMVDEIFLN